mmetsp:Transcript_1469/g.3056  ORF Transcript_1469/g.3056 Transcript_1469/m.3056 type:complete len:116 (+) Transcript_1469:168-515(+)
MTRTEKERTAKEKNATLLTEIKHEAGRRETTGESLVVSHADLPVSLLPFNSKDPSLPFQLTFVLESCNSISSQVQQETVKIVEHDLNKSNEAHGHAYTLLPTQPTHTLSNTNIHD